MRLKDKVAVVTGGGSGIGEGISIELAKEGAKVVVTDIDEKSAEEVAIKIKSNGGIAEYFKLDVTNSENIHFVTEKVKEIFGLIDIWVNSAGISIITPFFNHTEELWDLTMDINLKGQFLCCKEAIKQMLENGGGSIINMSSQSGKVGTNNYQAYCASKFGVIGLTQSLSKEFAQNGIRINSICPGVVNTPMWEKQTADYGRKRNIEPDKVMDYFRGKIPAKRLGTVEDIAKLVVYLASDDSSYITGQALNVNGGDFMS